MSFPAKSLQLEFLSNKATEDFFLSDDSDDAFNFKYTLKSQFKHIIKDVRTQRIKEEKEQNREFFMQKQDYEDSDSEEEDFDYPGVSNVKKFVQESMEEVHQELKRLKEDSLPENTKITLRSDYSVDKRIANVKENEIVSPKGMMQSEDATESTNMLLTIPEEINTPSACERSPISKRKYSTRKSHSEHALRPKSKSSRFNHMTNDSEYNYSSGLSERYKDNDKEDTCEVQPHPVVAHKILEMQKKISELLNEIALRLNKIPLPDGDRDLRRRQQRVMEFAIRFSRNYLYDLGRQIADIQRHVRAISSSARVKPTRRGVSLHMQAIENKLTSSHQLLLHALSAYCKHIPSSVLKDQPGKLEEILQVVIDLNNICAKIHLTTDYFGCGDVEHMPLGKDTQKQCNAILLKVRVNSDNESQLFSHTTQLSPVGGLRNKKRNSRTDNCRSLPAQLSMYSVDRRLSRNSGSKKLDPSRSREKRPSNVVFQTPPNHHPSTPELPNPSPTLYASTRGTGKRQKTKICLPQKEDEISTMMSTLATDSDAASSITISGCLQPSVSIHSGSNLRKQSLIKPPFKYSKCSNMPMNAELIVNDDQCNERAKQITNQQLSSLVPVIADLISLVTNQNDVAIRPVPSDSMEVLMELLKKYRSHTTNPDVFCDEEPNADLRVSHAAAHYEKSRVSTKRSIEIQNGAKNMQLIYFTLGENSRKTNGSLADKVCYQKPDEAPNASTTFGPVIKNQEIKTLRVNETSLTALLKYRDKYRYSSSSNPMYTSNSKNKPWDVVVWIANKLVDELIVDISKELQMEDIIRELFVLEFKEF